MRWESTTLILEDEDIAGMDARGVYQYDESLKRRFNMAKGAFHCHDNGEVVCLKSDDPRRSGTLPEVKFVVSILKKSCDCPTCRTYDREKDAISRPISWFDDEPATPPKKRTSFFDNKPTKPTKCREAKPKEGEPNMKGFGNLPRKRFGSFDSIRRLRSRMVTVSWLSQMGDVACTT